MDLFTLKNLLSQQAERLMKLEERLSDDPKAANLTEDDHKLIRQATLPTAEEHTDMLLYAFTRGNREWMKAEFERIISLSEY